MKRREALKTATIMGGSALLGTSLFSLLQSCKQQPRINWKPVFFTTEQAETMSALVDTLLPKTQTPGALEVKVDIFIDLAIKKMFNEQNQKMITSGLQEFEDECQLKFGKNFTELDSQEKVEIIKYKESNSVKYNGKVWGTAVGVQAPVGFYRTIKSMALWGYFSSEEIGKNILSYDPIPGDYLGCIPLSDVGNTYSL